MILTIIALQGSVSPQRITQPENDYNINLSPIMLTLKNYYHLKLMVYWNLPCNAFHVKILKTQIRPPAIRHVEGV